MFCSTKLIGFDEDFLHLQTGTVAFLVDSYCTTVLLFWFPLEHSDCFCQNDIFFEDDNDLKNKSRLFWPQSLLIFAAPPSSYPFLHATSNTTTLSVAVLFTASLLLVVALQQIQ